MLFLVAPFTSYAYVEYLPPVKLSTSTVFTVCTPFTLSNNVYMLDKLIGWLMFHYSLSSSVQERSTSLEETFGRATISNFTFILTMNASLRLIASVSIIY